MKKMFTVLTGILLSFCGFSQNWSLTGNAGTNPSTNFLGTTDFTTLVFRTNNTEAMRIDSLGRVGIGTTNLISRVNIFNNFPDHHLIISGDAPSVALFNGSATPANNLVPGRFALANGTAEYATTSVQGDVILANYGSNSLLFVTNENAGGNGLERMRINSIGYTGIGTSTPTARLDVNCATLSGQTNPSNVRLENLQSGAGTVLVIDSNGYVYKAASGQAASISSTPLATDMQNQIEELKTQVQELRSLLSTRVNLTPAQSSNLNAESSTWLGDNYPNPAGGSTTISYSLPSGVSAATCQVYTLDGKLVTSMVLAATPGKSQAQLITSKLSSGMYIYSLTVNGKIADTKKLAVSN